ncbi:MAG: hypothetical protein ACTHNW_15670 [Mucilaginibacter sp.]
MSNAEYRYSASDIPRKGDYGCGGRGGGVKWRGGAQLLTTVQAAPQSEASSSMVINLFFMMIFF